MATARFNYTFPKEAIDTTSASTANEITKSYYDFLVGCINNGLMRKAVCKRTLIEYGYESYYLISHP